MKSPIAQYPVKYSKHRKPSESPVDLRGFGVVMDTNRANEAIAFKGLVDKYFSPLVCGARPTRRGMPKLYWIERCLRPDHHRTSAMTK